MLYTTWLLLLNKDMSNIRHDIEAYIKKNPATVLGTINSDGTPHGAVVYVCVLTGEQLYFVTKTETQKFKNIKENPHVSITTVNVADDSSLQAGGKAHVVTDPAIIEKVMHSMTHIYAQGADWLPPISKLRAGPYQVIGIELTHSRLAQFKGKQPGSEHIFKEG